jgi:IS5 family transposase
MWFAIPSSHLTTYSLPVSRRTPTISGALLHLGVDAKTGRIVASTLTSKEVDDAAELGALLDQVDEPLAAVVADGAYDQDRVYDNADKGFFRLLFRADSGAED